MATVDIETLLDAISKQESNHNPKAYNPKSGAAGQFQFMPVTAKQYGLDNPYDPVASRNAARQMVMDLAKQYNGDIPKMLAGYNWGSGNVARKGMHRMPAETRNYIANITGNLGGGGGGESGGAGGGQGDSSEFDQWLAEQQQPAPVEQQQAVTTTDSGMAQPAPVEQQQADSTEFDQWLSEQKPKPTYWGNERPYVYIGDAELDKNSPNLLERAAAKGLQWTSDMGATAGGTLRTLGNLAYSGAGDEILNPENVNPDNTTANVVGGLVDPIATIAGLNAYKGIIGASKLANTAPWLKSLLAGAGSGAAVGLPSAGAELKEGDGEGAIGDIAASTIMGSGLSGIGHGLGAAGEAAVKNIGYPAKNMASRLLRESIPNVDNAIEQLNTIANLKRRGFMPNVTAGKAAAYQDGIRLPSGRPWVDIPELKVVEESSRLVAPDKYFAADLANKNAKLDYLRKIGDPAKRTDIYGTYHELSPAELRRQKITDPIYKAADKENLYVNPELEQMLKGEEISPLVNRTDVGYNQAVNNAQTAGTIPPAPIVKGGRVVEPPVNPMGSLAQDAPPAYGAYSELPYRTVQNLTALRSKIYDKAAKSSDPGEITRLKDAARQITAQLEKGSPTYARAQQVFKNASVPVNQGQLANELEQGLVTESGKYTPHQYLNTSANYEQLLKRTKLDKYFNHPNKVFDEVQNSKLEDLRRAVLMDARYKDMSVAGQTVDAEPLAAEIAKDAPSTLNRTAVVAKKAIGVLGNWQNKKVQDIIAEAWLNPSTAAKLLREQPKSKQELMIEELRKQDFTKALMFNSINNIVD